MEKIAEIKSVLKQLGITPDLNGYHYLAKGIEMIRDDFSRGKAPTGFMVVYQEISSEFATSLLNVERCIRHCVGVAKNNKTELYDVLFGNFKVVKSSIFISIIAEYVL